MRLKSERDILAQIRHLRHQLDRHRLTRTRADLTRAQQEIVALRAQLNGRPPAPEEPAPKTNGG